MTFHGTLAEVEAANSIRCKYYVLAERFESVALAAVANRYRDRAHWTVLDLPFGHDLMIDAPLEVADILERAAR
jgi:hypothetical protein